MAPTEKSKSDSNIAINPVEPVDRWKGWGVGGLGGGRGYGAGVTVLGTGYSQTSSTMENVNRTIKSAAVDDFCMISSGFRLLYSFIHLFRLMCCFDKGIGNSVRI